MRGEIEKHPYPHHLKKRAAPRKTPMFVEQQKKGQKCLDESTHSDGGRGRGREKFFISEA
jgi:hypothetical protein